MKGIVEVYSCDENGDFLILREENLIVDGAGKTIVDMLTISPSLSSIPSASSLLDASNFSIKALTFGAASASYQRNLHSVTYPQIVSALTLSSFIVYQNPVTDSYVETASGYYPDPNNILPKYPDPLDTKLENTCSPSGSWGPVTSIRLPYTTSGGYLIEDFGHHMNVAGIPAIYNEFGVSSPIAIVIGSYAPSNAAASGFLVSTINQINTTATPPFVSALTGGTSAIQSNLNTATNLCYNGRQCVDRHGFINVVTPSAASGVTTLNFSAGTGGGSGIQLSAPGNFSSTCELVYGTRIAQADVRLLHLYGGIFNAGLWTIDLQKTLQAGNNPPYSFNNLNNPIKYRLFCKKTFTKSLTYNTTVNQSNIQLVWRIKFI